MQKGFAVGAKGTARHRGPSIVMGRGGQVSLAASTVRQRLNVVGTIFRHRNNNVTDIIIVINQVTGIFRQGFIIVIV